jgi:hypothetical protein
VVRLQRDLDRHAGLYVNFPEAFVSLGCSWASMLNSPDAAADADDAADVVDNADGCAAGGGGGGDGDALRMMLVLSGDPSVGKSFLFELARQLAVPGQVVALDHVTPRAFNTHSDMSDVHVTLDELPPRLFHGDSDATFKTMLSKGYVVTLAPAAGRREARVSTSRCANSLQAAVNEAVPRDGPLYARVLDLHMRRRHRFYWPTTARFETGGGGGGDAWLHGWRVGALYAALAHKALEAGLLDPVDTILCGRTLGRIFAHARAVYGVAHPGPRMVAAHRHLCVVYCVWHAVHQEFLSDGGGGGGAAAAAAGQNRDSEGRALPFSFAALARLQPRLWVTEEQAVFCATLLADVLVPPHTWRLVRAIGRLGGLITDEGRLVSEALAAALSMQDDAIGADHVTVRLPGCGSLTELVHRLNGRAGGCGYSDADALQHLAHAERSEVSTRGWAMDRDAASAAVGRTARLRTDGPWRPVRALDVRVDARKAVTTVKLAVHLLVADVPGILRASILGALAASRQRRRRRHSRAYITAWPVMVHEEPGAEETPQPLHELFDTVRLPAAATTDSAAVEDLDEECIVMRRAHARWACCSESAAGWCRCEPEAAPELAVDGEYPQSMVEAGRAERTRLYREWCGGE